MANPKEKMIQAAVELMKEGLDPEKLTTRQIAKKAQVAHGLINYYFGSKDALLSDAVNRQMKQELQSQNSLNYEMSTARERILSILMTRAQLGLRYRGLLRFSIKQDLKEAGRETIQLLLPLLRQHFQGKRSEEELWLTAAQLVHPMELLFLFPETLEDHLGWDMNEPRWIQAFFEKLLSNLGMGS